MKPHFKRHFTISCNSMELYHLICEGENNTFSLASCCILNDIML